MNKMAFDIGGTTIEYTVDGKDKQKFMVDGRNKEQLLAKIAEVIDAKGFSEVEVGLSSPTAVDQKTGYCNGMSGIKDYENFNLYEELSKKVNTKISKLQALNDANASLLGIIKKYYPKEKPSSAVMVSLGTGIGGAIYIDGKIYAGADNMAGEFGYPQWNGDLNVSRSLSPVNIFKRHFDSIDGREIFNSYDTDEKSKKIIDTWLEDMGKFISFIDMFINPEIIVFNGGVTHNKKFTELLQKHKVSYFEKLGITGLTKTKLVFFNDNENYGLLGAEALLD